jgi:hypothetical protein
MDGNKDSPEKLERWERPIIIANSIITCKKCQIPMMGIGRKVKCKQCGEEYTNNRFSNYIAMIAEMFQYTAELKVHTLRVHLPYTDAILNIFKTSFHVEEIERKPVVTKNDKTGESITVLEIQIEKYIK